MDVTATLLGGLGLFFLGVKQLSGPLAALAGPRMRMGLAGGLGSAALLGLLLGGLTQSSNAVTFITASMRAAGLLSLRRALPLLAWANVGTAGLVLVATFDLRLAALWVLFLAGALTFLDRGPAPGANAARGRRRASDTQGRLRPALAALTGLGLMLLGLGLLQAGAAPLRDWPAVQALLGAASGFTWLLALAGAGLVLVTQSSSTVSILLITLHAAGLISLDQAAAGICGASLGSGLAVWLLGRGLRGTARQVVLFQCALRALGAVVFLMALWVERVTGLPLLLAATGWLAEGPGTRLALLFLALQLAMALLTLPLLGAWAAWVERRAPADAAEAAGQPRFLYVQALADPPSALPLVVAEQARLLARLPGTLGPLRGEPPHPDSAGSPSLEAAIGHFLSGLLARELAPEELTGAVTRRAAQDLLVALREAVEGFTEAGLSLAAVPEAAPRVAAMAEALHLLLEELAGLAPGEDAAWLVELAADRGEMMQRLRREAAQVVGARGQEAMFRLTGLFERAVWLIRRLALQSAEALRPEV